jgi:hypothetical protein
MLLNMNYVTHSGLCSCYLLWIMLLNQDFVYVTYYELCYWIRTLYMLLIMNYVTQSGLCLCYLLWIMLLNQDFVYVTYYELCYSIRTLFMLLNMNYATQSELCLCYLLWIMLLNQDFAYVTYYEIWICCSIWKLFMLLTMILCYIQSMDINICHPRFYAIYFI